MADAVDAAGIIFALFFVATRAIGRRQMARMHQVFDAVMTIHAIERRVDRLLEGVGGKQERDLFPIHDARG